MRVWFGCPCMCQLVYLVKDFVRLFVLLFMDSQRKVHYGCYKQTKAESFGYHTRMSFKKQIMNYELWLLLFCTVIFLRMFEIFGYKFLIMKLLRIDTN